MKLGWILKKVIERFLYKMLLTVHHFEKSEKSIFSTFFDFSLFQKVKNKKKCKKIFSTDFLWQSRISYFTDFLLCLYVNFNENGCDEQSQG